MLIPIVVGPEKRLDNECCLKGLFVVSLLYAEGFSEAIMGASCTGALSTIGGIGDWLCGLGASEGGVGMIFVGIDGTEDEGIIEPGCGVAFTWGAGSKGEDCIGSEGKSCGG